MLTACEFDAEEIDWINIKLGHVLPEPQSNLMELHLNDDDYLFVYIHDISENDYYEYQRWCENDKGFNIDKKSIGSSLDAYNQEGYYLSLRYIDYDEEMSITLQAPIPMEDFEIPEFAVASGLPIPSSKKGKFNWQYEDRFYLYVGETSKDEFLIYKKSCIDAGFINEPYEGELAYSATNSEGYNVSLRYKGCNVITIEFQSPKSDDDGSVDYSINYNDAKSFENALNKGEKVKDKVVKFEVLAYKPNSLLGINCHAGEHLNFISENELDVKKGDAVIGRITKEPTEFLGSWEVPYEVLKIEKKEVETDSNNNTPKPDTETSTPTPEKPTPEKPTPVFYSTNDYSTAQKGNSGIFSYKNKSGSYDVYWIIDFDAGYVYYFTDGNGSESCDKVKIVSGNLNDRVTITWDYGGEDKATWYLHFKYVNSPVTLIVNDHLGLSIEFKTTDLDDAINVRNSKTITEY